MRILVSGSTGLLGTALIGVLESEGHTIARLVRPDTPRRRRLAGNKRSDGILLAASGCGLRLEAARISMQMQLRARMH